MQQPQFECFIVFRLDLSVRHHAMTRKYHERALGRRGCAVSESSASKVVDNATGASGLHIGDKIITNTNLWGSSIITIIV